jgi:hypothetical protein
VYIVQLDDIMYRTRFKCYFYHLTNPTNKFKIETIVDSGCANTLLPLCAAKKCGGIALPLKKYVNIAGNSREAQAYIIPKFEFGGFMFTNVFAFVAEFQRELKERMLLGLNVLNNLRYTVDRDAGEFEFVERLPKSLKQKNFPYRNYFDDFGNYVMLSDNFVG